MDPAHADAIASINGIDLSDYFLDKSSCNPIVYIHKRFLPKEDNAKSIQANLSEIQNKSHHTYKINDVSTKTDVNEKDPLVEQTIKFAKDIIPLTIPPSADTSADPVYYTIKSCKKTKRKHEPCEHKSYHNGDVRNNEKLRHRIGHEQESKRNKGNTEDSLSRSSQNNTIDDINENHSLCYSLSEASEQRHSKGVHESKNKRREFTKNIPSETFEGIASEYINTNDSNIKIHLMNENEKQLFCESISSPIAKTLKELVLELNNQSEVRHDMLYLHKTIENQSNKLNSILDKLTHIEDKIDKLTKEPNITRDVYYKSSKTSKLEEIGKDILQVKDNLSSEEELAQVDYLVKRGVKTVSMTSMNVKDKEEIDDDLSKGENVPEHCRASISQLGAIKSERPNRIPARFCWTDTVRKN